MRLGILATHPIQYQAPWFRALAREADLEVFFAHRPDAAQQGEGFNKAFEWNVDLFSGYKHRFLTNVAKNPSASRCDTPEVEQIIGERRKEIGDRAVSSPVVSGQWSRGLFDAFIVSGWHVKSYWQAVRACRKAGVPVFVRGDSQLNTPRSLLKRLLKYLPYRYALSRFDGFLSVGQKNREYLLHYGVPESRVFFVPHFVDNEWFRQNAEILKSRKAEIRKEWGIPENAFCILFVGKFIRKKRPMDIIEAAKLNSHLQSANYSRVHLLFVGSGELGPKLRSSCKVVFDAEAPAGVRSSEFEVRKTPNAPASDLQSPTSDSPAPGAPLPAPGAPLPAPGAPLPAPGSSLPSPRSRLPAPHSCLPPASFAGFLNQSEIPRAYVAADVLVLPSHGGETWGLVVNEAMACGLPAIVSDAVGCAPDLIDEGKTGYTFPLGDVNALASRLEQVRSALLQDANAFSQALKQKMQRYSLDTAVANTLEAIRAQGGKR